MIGHDVRSVRPGQVLQRRPMTLVAVSLGAAVVVG